MNYILVSYIPNCIEVLFFFVNMKILTFGPKILHYLYSYWSYCLLLRYLDNLPPNPHSKWRYESDLRIYVIFKYLGIVN